MTDSPTSLIRVRDLRVGYGDTRIIDGLNLDLPGGGVTTIIGPNGCGKSTLLRAMAHILPAESGSVTIGGHDAFAMPRKQLARQLGMLPQHPVAPEGIAVADLVARGRHPHQTWFNQWSSRDADIVAAALAQTGVAEFADRTIDHLSGGQRQRVWIAMVLAQQTPVIFLDEPTTYLDLSHSLEILRLVRRLTLSEDRSVVMVLHDLNLAMRYSDHLVVMRDGQVLAQGAPSEVITAPLLDAAFDLAAEVIEDPVTGGPLIVPLEPS